MPKCKNCKHYGRHQATKSALVDWCNLFNVFVSKNMTCCLKFEQRRYFEVTRGKEN